MKRRCPYFLLVLFALLSGGCQEFDSPPQVSFPDANDPTADVKILPDPSAPLVIQFSEPVDPATLTLSVIRLDLDMEGNLLPEEERQIYWDKYTGGTGVLDDSRTLFTVDIGKMWPLAQTMAVVIEPGLTDDEGNDWTVQLVLKFSYEFECNDQVAATTFPSGTYFWMVDVEEPLAVQLRFWGAIVVDPETGRFRGGFSDSMRKTDQDCGFTCKDEEVCRLLPEPECVLPSESIATVDEYPDLLPDPTPPTGYSFFADGCVMDQDDGTYLFANEPVDVVVEVPAVTVTDTVLSSLFQEDDQGVMRGTGTLTSPNVFLGANPFGAGVGIHVDRMIPPSEVPPGVPQPDEQ